MIGTEVDDGLHLIGRTQTTPAHGSDESERRRIGMPGFQSGFAEETSQIENRLSVTGDEQDPVDVGVPAGRGIGGEFGQHVIAERGGGGIDREHVGDLVPQSGREVLRRHPRQIDLPREQPAVGDPHHHPPGGEPALPPQRTQGGDERLGFARGSIDDDSGRQVDLGDPLDPVGGSAVIPGDGRRTQPGRADVETDDRSGHPLAHLASLVEHARERVGSLLCGPTLGDVPLPTAPPQVSSQPRRLADLCAVLIEHGGSDLHLRATVTPRIRVAGALLPLGEDMLQPEEVEALICEALLADGRAVDSLVGETEADWGLTLTGIGRFRAHAYRQRGTWALVLRSVALEIPSWESLRLPRGVESWAQATDGLVVVAGPTGSGKSTTLAALVDAINTSRSCHILTIEDPIEYVHTDRVATVSQREVHTDTPDIASALRAGLREDPDVIVIGEVRDAETVWTALRAAETGHLVLMSIHARSTLDAIGRIIDLVPYDEQQLARGILAEVLRGVVAQRLVPAVSGGTRRVVCEVAEPTGRVREAVRDPSATSALPEIIADGEFHGMHTLDQDAVRLVLSGEITLEAVESIVSHVGDLHLALRRAGVPVEDLSSNSGSR